MFTQYISPLEKAKKYLSTQQFDASDDSFIEQAKKSWYSEDAYLPAIASKKMRQQDAELQSKYTQYKESPTTFMSNFKSEYGKEDRWPVWATLGFVWNTIMDLWENVEEIGSMAAHPIETAKWLGNIVAHPVDTSKALWWAVKENFGSIEKAKETFYENPFDVLSILIPAAKLGKAGKLATLAKDASGLWKVTEAAKAGQYWAKLGKAASATAWFVSKHEELIGKLADISNWDINIAKAATKWISWAASVWTDFASSLMFWAEWKDVLKNLLSRTKTDVGRESLSKYKQMSEEWIIKEFEGGMATTEKYARTELDNAAKQSAELTPISWGMVSENLYKWETLKAPFQKWGTMFTEYKFGDASKGEYINVAEKWVKQSAEAIEAQDTINKVMKEMKMPKNWLDNFSPTKSQNVITKLDDAVKWRLKWVALSENGQNLVKNYIKWMKEAQNTSFPLIKRAREGFKEFSDFSDELASETSLSARQSIIAKRIASAWNKETLQSAIKYLQKRWWVNLTDMATAIASKKLVWRGSMIALWAGWLTALTNPMYLVGAIGYTALTSPAMIYQIAQKTGSLRAIKTMWVEKLAGISKKLWVTPEEMRKAMINAYTAKDWKAFVNLAKQVGKWTLDRRSLWLIERMLKWIQEQYSNQSDKLNWDIGQMETAMQEWLNTKQLQEQPQIEIGWEFQPKSGELKYKWEPFNL